MVSALGLPGWRAGWWWGDIREQWAGPAGRCAGGWLGAPPAGSGRGRDVSGLRGAARAPGGKRSCRRRRSLQAAKRPEQPVAWQRSALPIMSLSCSLSRLRTQVHFVLKKSVHSVAVIGAPFSRGQVRTRTWHRGTGSPPARTRESGAAGG